MVDHILFKQVTVHDSNISAINDLASDHEEADKNLAALVHAVNFHFGGAVMIRSPSRDIDILAFFIAHGFQGVHTVVGSGKTRNIDARSTTLDLNEKKSLVCLYEFPVNEDS